LKNKLPLPNPVTFNLCGSYDVLAHSRTGGQRD